MSVVELIAQAEQNGIELVPLGLDALLIRGWLEEGRRFVPGLKAHKYDILAYLTEHRVRSGADAVLAAERILRSRR